MTTSIETNGDIERVADALLTKATGKELDQASKGALALSIRRMLVTYSRGDWQEFLEFRAPKACGENLTWHTNELQKYMQILPSAAAMKSAVEAGHMKPAELFADYSIDTPRDILKWAFIAATQMKVESTGRSVYCTDCWKGVAIGASSVNVQDRPFDAKSVALARDHAGVEAYKPDVGLKPGTPVSLYALVQLILSTDTGYKAYPLYVQFAYVKDLATWIPTEFVKGVSLGSKDYVF